MSTDPQSNSETHTQAKSWLIPEQIETMRDACLGESFPTYLQDRNETIVVVLADTGLRVGELVALDWDLIDLEADPGEIFLPNEIQKGSPGASYIDLDDETSRQLRRYKNRRWKETEAVFPSRQSDRMTTRSVRNTIKRIADVADVEPQLIEGGTGDASDVSPHTFRHSIAFRMIRREGKRLEDVQLRLRHKNLRTTDEIYGHLRRR
ncbi:tyrosine-type recombinase/integrase [Natrinema sp. DC36]|uniref:tyrosine-type recombinase/integrase n=1 Tax=Natrinema sp. DC36 TaxID=2878680 RepID=UPI001CF04321|nr:tyrosine-type recombinase/integrase [Natrinema sp. DC36]